MLSDPFNPENDLFKNARRQKTTGNHVVNSDRVVTQKAWNGDPDEEFHWHDRRRRKRTETVSYAQNFWAMRIYLTVIFQRLENGQRLNEVITNEFNL